MKCPAFGVRSGRYQFKGEVANTRFERDCLAEYAEVFKTVSVDASYYDSPRADRLHRLSSQVPDNFQFAFKVTFPVLASGLGE
jgi:uncharacterized protein YecE (DUF72 family)